MRRKAPHTLSGSYNFIRASSLNVCTKVYTRSECSFRQSGNTISCSPKNSDYVDEGRPIFRFLTELDSYVCKF